MGFFLFMVQLLNNPTSSPRLARWFPGLRRCRHG
jgi:hypothetical protein